MFNLVGTFLSTPRPFTFPINVRRDSNFRPHHPPTLLLHPPHPPGARGRDQRPVREQSHPQGWPLHLPLRPPEGERGVDRPREWIGEHPWFREPPSLRRKVVERC